MSFLVLVLTDRVQKEQVNRLRSTHPSRANFGLVYYNNDGDQAHAAGKSLELPNAMPIVEAYFKHVELHIYSHQKARKMLSLDGDPVRVRGAAVRHRPPLVCSFRGAIQPTPVCLRRSCLPRCLSIRSQI